MNRLERLTTIRPDLTTTQAEELMLYEYMRLVDMGVEFSKHFDSCLDVSVHHLMYDIEDTKNKLEYIEYIKST